MGKFAEVNMIVSNFGYVVTYFVLLKELTPHAFYIVGIEGPVVSS
jgi:hypothetical protein